MSNSCVCVYCLLSGCLVSSLMVVKAKRNGRLPSLWRGEYEKKSSISEGPWILWKRTCWNSNTKRSCRTVFFRFTRETMKERGMPGRLIFKG
jgi:hypothetical protein